MKTMNGKIVQISSEGFKNFSLPADEIGPLVLLYLIVVPVAAFVKEAAGVDEVGTEVETAAAAEVVAAALEEEAASSFVADCRRRPICDRGKLSITEGLNLSFSI